MRRFSKRSLALISSVSALLLLIISSVVVYFFVWQGKELDVQSLTVTNVTSNSVTLTWVSENSEYAFGVAVEGEFIEMKFNENGDYSFSHGYDDRDIIKAELEENYDEARLQLEKKQLGKYKTHHVTFRGLSSEKEYTFLLNNGRNYVNLDEPVVVTTLKYPESLDNPKPAYGKVTVEGEKTSISEPVADGVFYYYLEGAVGQKVSNTISTPLAENGSWYLDLNSLLTLDGSKVIEKYTSEELLLMLQVGEVRSSDGNLYRKVIPMDANSPAEDFRLTPERQILELSDKEENELITQESNFIFVSGGGWSVDCNGKSYCASADVEALFNNVHGANGQSQWESEACASGAASTCGAGGTPGPQHQLTEETCSITYTEQGAYGGDSSCTSDCTNYGKKDINGNCIPEWGPGSICKPQASCGNTCSGTQCVEGQYCNGGGNAQCCTGSCVNVGQENPAPVSGVNPSAGSGNTSPGGSNAGSGSGTTTEKYWYCRTNDGSGYSCKKNSCMYGAYYKISEHSSESDCVNKANSQGGSASTTPTPYKLCYNNSVNNKFHYCGITCGLAESVGTYESLEVCNQERIKAGVTQAPNIPCTNCHNIPGTPTPVTPCPNCHSSSSSGQQSSTNTPSVRTESVCDGVLEARHSGLYCSKDRCGEKTDCSAEQCSQTSVPDLAVGMTQRGTVAMYRCSAVANFKNNYLPPNEFLTLYHTKSICESSCIDRTSENGIHWKGVCVKSWINPFLEYVEGTDPKCSTVGYQCKKGLDGRYALSSTDAHRCDYMVSNINSSNFNLVNKTHAQEEELSDDDVLFDPTTGLYYFPGEAEYEFFYGEETFYVQQNSGDGSILFIDKNSNGEFDQGDERILESPYMLSFQKIIDQSTYIFEPGYNLVSFDLMFSINKFRASDFLEYVNEIDDVIYSISTYQSGKWMTMGMRSGEPFGSDDFLIIPGKAYLVKLSTPAQFKFEGYRVDKPVALHLNSGWNLVPIHGSRKSYTAKSWLESLNKAGQLTADNVTKWEAQKGKYEGFQSDKSDNRELLEYGFDYPIDPKSGYFLKIKSGEGVWTPE